MAAWAVHPPDTTPPPAARALADQVARDGGRIQRAAIMAAPPPAE
jgi:hypothetical protein